MLIFLFYFFFNFKAGFLFILSINDNIVQPKKSSEMKETCSFLII
ncbi:hypothetical protein HMPREF1871_00605 [Gemelliphila asaccharolytica]|uniref:Uncharacterized protein n=1 Tax=Gemelliphila asaccharolytica TaxID=502393 RepID=A0ABR5TPG2_9BACL|nr:hypothetical protein HMPREF1871_00605 [Gemella asaccharolytica]